VKRLLGILVCFTFVLSPFIAGACPFQKDPGLVNGGFEDNFLGWTTGGSTGVVTVANLPLVLGQPDELTVTPFEGEKMGAITYPAMEGFVYDNFIYQDVLLEEQDKLLVLHYFFWTYDEAPFDSPAFTVSINGMTVYSMSAGDIGDEPARAAFHVGGVDDVGQRGEVHCGMSADAKLRHGTHPAADAGGGRRLARDPSPSHFR